jgi:hypothetical protein
MCHCTDNWLAGAPLPVLGSCRTHGEHAAWSWAIAPTPTGGYIITGTCLVDVDGVACGGDSSYAKTSGDVTLEWTRGPYRNRVAPDRLVELGRVVVPGEPNDEGRPREALILRAACDTAQAESTKEAGR